MSDVPTVVVEATDERYRALKHFPSGIAIGEDGRGDWPADSFTYRLVVEGALRIILPREAKPQPGPVQEPFEDAAPEGGKKSKR